MPFPDRTGSASSEPSSGRTGISATLAVNETIERKRREGVAVLPLGFGEAGLPLHPALTRELAKAAGRNSYGPVAGSPELRAAAAGYWTRRGLPTDPELVVAGPGSKALLFGLLLALGGEVALPCPSWVSYAAQAALTGAGALPVPTPPDEGGVPDPDLLAEEVARARRAGRRVRSVVVTLPDNPTGRLAGEPTVRRLCRAARELDLLIISDEIYRDLVHDPAVAVSSPALFAPERTVITTALSKHLAAGGWRLGVARLPDSPLGHRLRAELLGIGSEIWSCAPAPVQHAAAYAFSEPPELTEHVDRSRRLHAAVARAVAARFAAAGCRVPQPQASFYLYPDFSPLAGPLADRGVRTGPELAELLLEGHGVGTLPGSAFGEPDTALRLRVATSLLYGESEEQRLQALHAPDPAGLPWIARSLDRLSEVLEEVTAPQPALTGPQPAVV
ncbi:MULTISPECIES: pyridoxal phosphate-dependent aminotransferase [Thermomonospora]|uniref:Aminotransferase class I and II n=1 Tax=Thermomonospora curvata (strain ATCC 19995 / DSM 43183 / JCM 3096 / KCTC 9072 / NBRC 15933 / NCIMB 10081 / Henssen B9) TaxID=471852 RepID=D1A502_THECD|nr:MULTISPECIES: pyridoxal phosphate-dependent aminotransferase [Thermomonospora]ACY98171.1 aminotransferase class I and II [Thermomonospora curvata DSM 43183]